MLHRKSPRKILAIQDATFPALLKTLSDPAEAVVTRDLLLLSQISKSSDDISYFSSFMVNLLKLFATDRRLLETRGNLIIRQLCLSLSAEKIYRTMADCLEQEEDIEFASIMVQNLNNNLITAPELADLRKRLRNIDSPHPTNPGSAAASSGTGLFTVLYRAWTVNAIATISLCLLAQAYEQAYHLLQVFGSEIEMTVVMLIQIDKLVQLLESPVFTYLRMQLLEPERFPYLYKCLYGILMLLPQSSAFAALKNRLQSVSAIGYLHMVPPAVRTPGGIGAGGTQGTQTAGTVSSFESRNRLTQRPREGEGIRWTELLEKFKTTQERVRRAQQRQQLGSAADEDTQLPSSPQLARKDAALTVRPESAQSFGKPLPSAEHSAPAVQQGVASGSGGQSGEGGKGHQRHRSGLSQLGRLARAGGKAKKT
jgi:vacuole morphology and inheritance protein 14